MMTKSDKVTMRDVADLTSRTVGWLSDALSGLGVPVGVQTLHSVKTAPILKGDDMLPAFGSEVLWLAWAGGPAGPRVCVTRERYDASVYVDGASKVRDCATGAEATAIDAVTCPWKDVDPYTKFCTGLDVYRLAAAAWHVLEDMRDANPDDAELPERARAMFGVAADLARLAAASVTWRLDTRVDAKPTQQLRDAAAFTQAAFTRPGAC